MKKVFVCVAVAALGMISVQAQDIPDRPRGEFRGVHKERMFGKKDMANLNLTDEQKQKMKSMNQDFRKQMQELRKQDQITVKEYREKMADLQTAHRQNFQSILTDQQKEQLKKDREAFKEKRKEFGQKRQERMKQELNLSEEQSQKMAAARKSNQEKIKAIRENSSLTDIQKKEQVKELMMKQKEEMKKILTEEQLQKMKENRMRHGKNKKTIES